MLWSDYILQQFDQSAHWRLVRSNRCKCSLGLNFTISTHWDLSACQARPRIPARILRKLFGQTLSFTIDSIAVPLFSRLQWDEQACLIHQAQATVLSPVTPVIITSETSPYLSHNPVQDRPISFTWLWYLGLSPSQSPHPLCHPGLALALYHSWP